LVLTGFSAWAQTPLVINGVADQGDYADTISFSVPTASGYTYSAKLDGQSVPVDVTVTVTQVDYHQLSVWRTNLSTLAVTNVLLGFVVRGSIYGTTERGLPAWTPYPVINATAAESAGAQLRVLTPQDYPTGLEIPVVAWVEKPDGSAVRANAVLTAPGHPSIQLFRGAGSGFLAATNEAGTLQYPAAIPGVATNKTIHLEDGTTWTTVSGILSGANNWPANSRIAVSGHLTVPAGSSLTIGEGTIVRLNAGINITNDGSIVINGIEARPVVFTPVTRQQPWGGFLMRTSTGSLDANGTIFVASGAQQSGFPGHKPQQPLLMIDRRPRVALTNCAAIYMAGQFGHATAVSTNASDPAWTVINFVHTLVQRCITGGEWNGCRLKLLQSALIEIPFATPTFADADEDAIYFTTGEYDVRDTLIGWARDDGIDSGSNDGGSVTVSNNWHESIFHEAFAWSGGGGSPGSRRTTNIHCVAINCGQGYECGWSSGSVMPSPNDFVTDCLGLGNSIGARFGDNYSPAEGFTDYGFIRVTNTILLNNIRDVWGYNWQDWTYRVSAMDIQRNLLTVPNSHHPNNSVWNPATDAWRLASFLSTPPEAPVGIGFAVWTNLFALSAIFDGVPVGLSCFSTNVVRVGYSFRDSVGGTLAAGQLVFVPGETVKRIYPSGFDVAALGTVLVELSDPVSGELTGATTVSFQGTVAEPRVACWMSGRQADLARVNEGIPVNLSTRSALPVSVSYRFETDDALLAAGTLVFPPGQTLAWATAPGVNPQAHDLIRLTLANPVAATLGNLSTVYFIQTAIAPVPAPVSLIAKGAVWKYLDTGTNAGTTWHNSIFDDSGWKSGRAELGYGDGDERTVVSFGPSSTSKYITTYFRSAFDVPDPGAYTNLSMWLKRDDGGVVYLNGAEVFRTVNMPPPPATIAFNTLATGSAVENAIDTATLSASRLTAGQNVAAVEIHQQALDSSDISFDFELLGNPVPPPPPPQSIFLGSFDGQLVIAWGDPGFVLQQANQISGPWNPAANLSPAVITPDPGTAQKFYRLIHP
jgi:hypothetical protein